MDIRYKTILGRSGVPVLRMGKVSTINQFTDGYDIVSDTPELEIANTLEGIVIKIGNW